MRRQITCPCFYDDKYSIDYLSTRVYQDSNWNGALVILRPCEGRINPMPGVVTATLTVVAWQTRVARCETTWPIATALETMILGLHNVLLHFVIIITQSTGTGPERA